MTYAEKLKDPRWQKKRLEILERDKWKCVWCGDDKSTLHVHHQAYEGKNPWDASPYVLATLCEDCHSIEHLDLSPLERHLIDCLRNRHYQETDMIKLMNIVVRNYKTNG